MTPRLILASTSPRRRELLGLLGLPFEVVASGYDEETLSPNGLTPDEYVIRLALGKASEVAAQTEGDALVLGADTTVILDGMTLNKPADAEDARRMLRLLSGRTHQVYTGLCLISVRDGVAGEVQTDHAVTDVSFDTLSEETIAAYVTTGEPLDKAGAYGIQGKALSFIPASVAIILTSSVCRCFCWGKCSRVSASPSGPPERQGRNRATRAELTSTPSPDPSPSTAAFQQGTSYAPSTHGHRHFPVHRH